MLDCAKARARLGWTPRWNLERGIRATVDWYRADAGGADMRAMTLAQIERFQGGGE